MLSLTSNVQRPASPAKRGELKTNAKRLLLLVTCYLLLVLILSACSAIGISKPAALQITSTPEASVFLDGKHVGKTPFSSNQLKSGEYLVKLTAGEASYVGKINLAGGTLTVINRRLSSNFLASSGETLWLEKDKEGVFIVSMPAEADVVLDGTLIGQTPLLTADIAPGDHKITLTKTGYELREFAIKTADDWQLVADISLAAQLAQDTKGAEKLTLAPSPKIQVGKTPQGFLRVRQEPSTAALEIGRVKTGDELEVIQEKGDWVKIKFAGKLGWVSSQYVKKLP